MTDLTPYRLSLLVALVGVLTVIAHTWNLDRVGRVNSPTFERSAPDVREWPVHQYLPIG